MRDTGQCRCGRLRFRVSAQPLLTGACHCRGCQRMTGGAFSLTSTYHRDAFAIIAGDPVIGGLHSAETRHYHCGHCHSWVYTEPARMDWIVNIRTPMLEVRPAAPPFIESQTAERCAGAITGARHSYERFPPDEEYERIMAEYGEGANG